MKQLMPIMRLHRPNVVLQRFADDLASTRTSLGAVAALLLAACAGGASAPTLGQAALTKDEEIAIHTNTVVKGNMGNGDRFESVYGSDGTVKSRYFWNGGSDSDEGTWSLSGDNNAVCFAWNKWEKSCWIDYKAGDKYFSREQGGKRRTATFSVAAR